MNKTVLREALSDTYKSYLEYPQGRMIKRATAFNRQQATVELSESTAQEKKHLIPAYSLQNRLRPLYGKGEPSHLQIGDHPDFVHLRGTHEQCWFPITTLFMDIEKSTRLCKLYPPDQVFHIKNALICTAIEIIRSFDGHVHRIMGDAVMAYFGRVGTKPEVTAVDAINCATVLTYFVKHTVLPQLQENGFDTNFGIRVGVDHGTNEDVLWACYGYPGLEEVTATSFYVDAAAKLQQAAKRNQIMIGDSLKRLLDFPDDLVTIKTVERRGENVPKPFLEPNRKDANGSKINYLQHQLLQENYLRLGPAHHISYDGLTVSARVCEDKELEGFPYKPSTGPIDKNRWIEFSVYLNSPPYCPYTVEFRVTNNGQEALAQAGPDRGCHKSSIEVKTKDQPKCVTHWETTSYRGLHYMDIKISTSFNILYNLRFGVYVN